MKGIFTIIISVLLVVSLTSGLVGNTPPTLKTFTIKASEVTLDMKDVYSIFAEDVGSSLIDTADLTGEWYDFFITLYNGFITAINVSVIAPFTVVYDVFDKFDRVLGLFKGFYECAVYLLFGESTVTQ